MPVLPPMAWFLTDFVQASAFTSPNEAFLIHAVLGSRLIVSELLLLKEKKTNLETSSARSVMHFLSFVLIHLALMQARASLVQLFNHTIASPTPPLDYRRSFEHGTRVMPQASVCFNIIAGLSEQALKDYSAVLSTGIIINNSPDVVIYVAVVRSRTLRRSFLLRGLYDTLGYLIGSPHFTDVSTRIYLRGSFVGHIFVKKRGDPPPNDQNLGVIFSNSPMVEGPETLKTDIRDITVVVSRVPQGRELSMSGVSLAFADIVLRHARYQATQEVETSVQQLPQFQMAVKAKNNIPGRRTQPRFDLTALLTGIYRTADTFLAGPVYTEFDSDVEAAFGRFSLFLGTLEGRVFAPNGQSQTTPG